VRSSLDAVDIRELVHAQPGEAVAISVASLIPRKGHDLTLRALRHATTQLGARVQLVVVGSGSEESALGDLAHSLDVHDRVHFLGERGDVQALLRNADFFVAASHEEVQPLSVIEAMLCGLSVVASAIPAHVEMVESAGSGVLVDASDASIFGAAIADVAARSAELREARGRLSARALERYSFSRYVERFVNLYHVLAQTPQREYGFLRGLRRIPAYPEWAANALRRRLLGVAGRGTSPVQQQASGRE